MEQNGAAQMYRIVEFIAVATVLIKQVGDLAANVGATFRKLKTLKGVLKE